MCVCVSVEARFHRGIIKLVALTLSLAVISESVSNYDCERESVLFRGGDQLPWCATVFVPQKQTALLE